MLAENVNIKEFKEYKLVPRGMTALFDAIGRTANAVKDSNVTGKKIFVVVTDGQENRSTEWKNASAISSLISEMRENKWEFIFIGSDEKSLSEAKSLGMDMGKAFSFGGTSRGISDSYDAVSVYATSFRSGASSEEADKKLADIVSSSSTLKQ
jgi:Mg-chelatase subunit ChlD